MNRIIPCKTLYKLLYINILLTFCFSDVFSQTLEISPKKITFLTNSLDSLIKSYVKKGFAVVPDKREIESVASDKVYLEDGFEMEFETPFLRNSNLWQNAALKTYGAHISGLTFETDDPDSLFSALSENNIPCRALLRNDSTKKIEAFAIDSCHPLDVVFIRSRNIHRSDTLVHHINHIYRLDWMLLSAGIRMQEIFTKIFILSGAWALHEGCCDYWRAGTPDDLTFFRFEPLPEKTSNDPYWLSIEPDNFYWAYW